MVTPLGCGVETTWRHLIEGDLKMSAFDGKTQLHAFEQLTSKVAAIVPCGTNLGEFNEEVRLNSKNRSTARFISYALCAAVEALKDAKWAPTEQEQKERTGVSIGGGTGSIGDILDAAKMICDKGPNHAAVTACTTGAHSIGDAARMIQFGDSDVMVAGGT